MFENGSDVDTVLLGTEEMDAMIRMEGESSLMYSIG